MASSRRSSFGETKIVHKATIVWLHDIGKKGSDSARFVSTLNLPHVKWICPTAPKRHVWSMNGTTTAWCDVRNISENMVDDLVSYESMTEFVANLLSNEPNNVKIGLGGIGLGAAVALYFLTRWATGRQPVPLNVVVGINGWLPARRNLLSNLSSRSVAASLPILLTHGTSDQIVPFAFANNCAQTLRMAGFQITFKPNEGDHYSIVLPQVTYDVRLFLTRHLQL